MGRRNQRLGQIGESLTRGELERRGVLMPEEIATPVRLIPYKNIKGVFRVKWKKKVSGDHRGIKPDGQSVLVESKVIDRETFRWSDMRDHQPARLSEHAKHNGLSLLAWICFHEIFILRWPMEGFAPRKSIKSEWARDNQWWGDFHKPAWERDL